MLPVIWKVVQFHAIQLPVSDMELGFWSLSKLWAAFQECHPICLLSLTQLSHDLSHLIRLCAEIPVNTFMLFQHSSLANPWQQHRLFNCSTVQQLDISPEPRHFIVSIIMCLPWPSILLLTCPTYISSLITHNASWHLLDVIRYWKKYFHGRAFARRAVFLYMKL